MKIYRRFRQLVTVAVCLVGYGCEKKPAENGPIPPGEYAVLTGDNLSNVALRAYGEMKLGFALLNANPELTKRPGFDLIPGETINVPPKAELVRKLPKSVFPTRLPADYIVMPGDSLFFIAKGCYGDRNLWRRIYDANRNVLSQQVETNPFLLIAGQVLHIPAKENKGFERENRRGGDGQ